MRKQLLQLCCVVLFALMANFAIAQGTISGTLLDAQTGEGLISASVTLKGTNYGTVSDIDGNFTITEVPAGTYTLMTTYVGFVTLEKEVTVTNGQNTDAGKIKLNASAVGIQEVEVIASVAIDRKTPVAVSTIKGAEIEALIGNQEYPEILRSTPSIYVTKQGGGFGDARINVRGFDQRNTAVMINGIPVNDMENGWVYWSNWAGLSDVTSTMQVQRGLGASKLAVPAVGGTINIVTNAADFEKGGKVSLGVGNDGYQKYGLMLSSGLNDNGFAATAQFTHTRGDGYVDGTKFQAYSYFVSLSKQFNSNHTLAFTAVGAPQWHHQRTLSNFDRVYLQTFEDKGIKYNPVWGTLDGEEFTWRRNFYHKPKAFVNHYWNISENTELKTSAYVSLGRGGGTGPRGRLRTPGSVFDSYSGDGVGIHDANGQVRFDDLVAYNQGQAVDTTNWGLKLPSTTGNMIGSYVNTSNGRFNGSGDEGSGFVRRASMNSHNWFGVLSTLTHKFNENLQLVAGIDGRYYRGQHYRRLENLLGADAYLSQSDDNNPANYITNTSPADFGNFSDKSYKTGNNVLAYHNDGVVSWLGLFTQLEYSLDDLTVFGSLSGSNQGFKRIDFFNYLDSDPLQETDFQNFMGGTVKAGANYNLNETMNVFANAGYLSKQPIFDNVFLNFRNDINPDVQNQSVVAFEAGYGLRTNKLRANVNIYTNTWANRQYDQSFTTDAIDAAGDTIQVSALASFSNVGEVHSGLEVDFSYRPIRQLTIDGMMALNNWEYKDNFVTNLSNTDGIGTLIGETTKTLYAEGLKVGDAAQTTFNLRATVEPVAGFRVYGNWYHARNLYSNFNLTESQFFSPNGQVVQLPAYSLVDAGASYRFKFNNMNLIARININNLFDTKYIAEMFTNVVDDPDTDENEFYTRNQGFYGFGRTWNASLKFEF